MKRTFFAFIFFLIYAGASACPGCDLQKPKALRGLGHGGSPDSNWDYFIVAVAMAIVVLTFYFSVKWLIVPGEKSKDHIKYIILQNEG